MFLCSFFLVAASIPFSSDNQYHTFFLPLSHTNFLSACLSMLCWFFFATLLNFFPATLLLAVLHTHLLLSISSNRPLWLASEKLSLYPMDKPLSRSPPLALQTENMPLVNEVSRMTSFKSSRLFPCLHLKDLVPSTFCCSIPHLSSSTFFLLVAAALF